MTARMLPDDERQLSAVYALHPIQHAARAVGAMTLQDDSRLDDLCHELGEQVRFAKEGNLGRPVAMLTAQAHTLEATFYYLLSKATSAYCASEIEMFLRPAFRAQSQCRRTLETLSSLSNPRTVAIVQTNIGANIQVNNSTTLTSGSENAPNKLMEQTNGTGLDAGATLPTINRHSAVAALEIINGAQNDGR